MSFEHNCNHEHCTHQQVTSGDEWNLYLKIDTNNVVCLNEEVDGSCKKIFRSWDDRLSKDNFVNSDVDQELLIYIPFNGCVKLKSIIVIGGEEGSHPRRMRLYSNKCLNSFDDVNCAHDQELELVHDAKGEIAYPLKIVKFSSVYELSIYIPQNYGDESTIIYYIGLQGDFLGAKRQEAIITSYEAYPNPADHKLQEQEFSGLVK